MHSVAAKDLLHPLKRNRKFRKLVVRYNLGALPRSYNLPPMRDRKTDGVVIFTITGIIKRVLV